MRKISDFRFEISGGGICLGPGEGFFGGGEGAFELGGLDGFEDGAEVGARFPAEVDEVAAGEEGWGDEGFAGEFFGFCFEEVEVVEGTVAALAVDAVEFEFLGKAFAGHEAFQFGGAHVLHVFEDHVLADGFGDALDVVAGEAEAVHEFFGHGGADAVVSAEADAVFVGVVTEGGGFADVVEEDGEGGGGGGVGREQFEHGAGVDEDVAFGMELRGLLAAFEFFDLGEDFFEESALVEEVEAADAVRVGDDFDEFLADAFGADGVDVGGVNADGVPRGGFDLVVETGGEADGAEEAEFVFAEAGGGIADGAEGPGFEVGLAADEVDELVRDRIVEHAVDGEVAAVGVFLGRGEGDHLGTASVDVFVVGAEGGDLEGAAVFHDQDDAEVGADGLGVGEKFLHLGGFGGGGDVIVAYAAAGEIGGVAGLLQAAGDFGGGGFEVHLLCGSLAGAVGDGNRGGVERIGRRLELET